MRVPDKGPQSLETTEFSKLIILLWSMPQNTSALTSSSMPTSPLHLQPDPPRLPWSMPTNARALQTCNGNSIFYQNTNRGKGGTTLSYNSSALGEHTQAELVSLSCLPVRTQPRATEGAPKKQVLFVPNFVFFFKIPDLVIFNMWIYKSTVRGKTDPKAICFLFRRGFWI